MTTYKGTVTSRGSIFISIQCEKVSRLTEYRNVEVYCGLITGITNSRWLFVRVLSLPIVIVREGLHLLKQEWLFVRVLSLPIVIVREGLHLLKQEWLFVRVLSLPIVIVREGLHLLKQEMVRQHKYYFSLVCTRTLQLVETN